MWMESAAKAIIAQTKILSILIIFRMMKNFITFIFYKFLQTIQALILNYMGVEHVA